MSLRSHRLKVLRWRQQYGVVEERKSFDPINTSVSVCFICKKHKRRMERHHTGFDSIFADMLPDVFAAQYVQFKKEDCELLCSYHHKRAHTSMEVLVAMMFDEKDANMHRGIEPTEDWCRKWIARFRAHFYEWASRYKLRRKG